MNSQQTIIEKIIGDANAAAQAELAQAQSQKDVILSDAKTKASAVHSATEASLQTIKSEIISRRKTVAQIDAKKLLLGTKKQLIEQAFKSALSKLAVMDKKRYLSIVADMLNEADDNDTVIISKNDDGIITANFIKKCAEKRGIKLVLSDSFGDFEKGIVLRGEQCDKNFTFDLELQRLQEAIESEVAVLLFKEEANGNK